jgi:phage terminase large subunit-like protein
MRRLEWSTACPDWRQRIIAGESLIPFTPLFPDEAESALTVFKSLKAVDIAGCPRFGDVCRPWVFDFVAAVFGAYNEETGRQLINEFLLLISKKNGKSTIAAGIMVTALVLNWRQMGELTILAPTIEVARNSADPAMAMVQRDEELLEILRPIPHLKTIEHRTTGASLKIVAADSETVAGGKAGFVLIDEEWLFGKSSKAENMLREAIGGLAARPEGWVIKLSTQSDEPPAGVWKDDLIRFRDIRDGKLIAPRSLGVLYEFPTDMVKDGSYKKPENWYITNPNLDASVDRKFIHDEWEKAKRNGPKSLVGFYAKYLNIEPGIGQRSDGWAGAEYWKRQDDSEITLQALIDRSEVIVVGLDGGGLDDLYGLYLIGREPQEIEVTVETEENGEKIVTKKRVKRWLGWGHAWCHRIVLERRQTIASVLEDFEKAGTLTIIDDTLGDVDQIVEIIKRVRDAGKLYCVAVDPAGLGDMVDALSEARITQDNKETERNFVVGVSQGYGLMNAIKTAERKLANRTLIHSPSGVMDWAVGNLKIEPTATAIRATKQNAGDAKIDPVMALFDAASIMQMNPPAQTSVYETKELLVL